MNQNYKIKEWKRRKDYGNSLLSNIKEGETVEFNTVSKCEKVWRIEHCERVLLISEVIGRIVNDIAYWSSFLWTWLRGIQEQLKEDGKGGQFEGLGKICLKNVKAFENSIEVK